MQEQQAPHDLLALYEAIFGESPRLSQVLDPKATWRRIAGQVYRELFGRLVALAVACREIMSVAECDRWIAGELHRLACDYWQDLVTSLDLVGATWRHHLRILGLSPPEGFGKEDSALRSVLPVSGGIVGEQHRDPLEDFGLAGELLLLVGPPVPHGVRLRTARRLARPMAPSFANPTARKVLRQLAAQWKVAPHDLLLDQLFPEGLLLAAADTERPRPIRLGRRRVGGKAAEVSPLRLSLLDYAAWLRQEAYRHATEKLVGPRVPALRHHALGPDDCPACGTALGRSRVCPRCGLAIPKAPFGVPRDRLRPVAPRPGNVLDALIAADTMRVLLGASTPQECEVLLLVDRGTPPGEAVAAVAPTPVAARQLLSRLRKKVRRLR